MEDFDFDSYNDMFTRCKNKHLKGITNLVEVLKNKYKIEYSEDKYNVCFVKNDKLYKIAKETFYRVCGQCVYAYETGAIYKDVKLVGVKEFTDDMFYEKMKMFILFVFKIETV